MEIPDDPRFILETLTSYQRSAVLKGAIELDLFTTIAEGVSSIEEIATRLNASERGIRTLCDYLVVMGLLTKGEEGAYGLTPLSSRHLDRHQGADYMGTLCRFLTAPTLRMAFEDVAGAVRRGGTTLGQKGTMRPAHPVWVDFARGMHPIMAGPARDVAKLLKERRFSPKTGLDIAAGHGLYGIEILEAFPDASMTALDWPDVLVVARDNARTRGVDARLSLRGGDAFSDDLGGPYDLVLLPNFLHHFDDDRCITLLSRIREAMNDGGVVVSVEPIAEENRIEPPSAATFSMVMLATTEGGDTLTLAQLRAIHRRAGFSSIEAVSLAPSVDHAILAVKRDDA